MIFSAKYPLKRLSGVALPLFAFALIQLSAAPVMAGNTLNSQISQGPRTTVGIRAPGTIAKYPKLVQRQQPIAGGRYPGAIQQVPQGGGTPPGNRNPNPGNYNRGGGGGGITIDPNRLFAPRPYAPPPRAYYPRPAVKKKTNTARRRPPRRRVQPPALKTIPQFIPNEILVFVTSDQADALGLKDRQKNRQRHQHRAKRFHEGAQHDQDCRNHQQHQDRVIGECQKRCSDFLRNKIKRQEFAEKDRRAHEDRKSVV